MLRASLAALALCLPAMAGAHSFWLQPVDHSIETGETVEIDFKIGDVGESGDWSVYWERVGSIRLYGPKGVADQLRSLRAARAGDKGGAQLAVDQPGSYVLGFESNPSFSDLEGARFDRYVEGEGLAAIAAHRRAIGAGNTNGTEIYARRAKALLQVGDVRTDNITRPIGQLLEIVPLDNPFALENGDSLRVQVLWRGEPLEGAQLNIARTGIDGESTSLVTDEQGKVAFPIQSGPPYLLAVVWGVPAPHDPRADYFTIFSSLTFAIEG